MKIFQGMYRPAWDVFLQRMPSHRVDKFARERMCSCGDTLGPQVEWREHWQRGHFDEVVNIDVPVDVKTTTGGS